MRKKLRENILYIALNAGIAGGADIILIPEIKYSLKSISDHIEKTRSNGRNHILIVVAAWLVRSASTRFSYSTQLGLK